MAEILISSRPGKANLTNYMIYREGVEVQASVIYRFARNDKPRSLRASGLFPLPQGGGLGWGDTPPFSLPLGGRGGVGGTPLLGSIALTSPTPALPHEERGSFVRQLLIIRTAVCPTGPLAEAQQSPGLPASAPVRGRSAIAQPALLASDQAQPKSCGRGALSSAIAPPELAYTRWACR